MKGEKAESDEAITVYNLYEAKCYNVGNLVNRIGFPTPEENQRLNGNCRNLETREGQWEGDKPLVSVQ